MKAGCCGCLTFFLLLLSIGIAGPCTRDMKGLLDHLVTTANDQFEARKAAYGIKTEPPTETKETAGTAEKASEESSSHEDAVDQEY